MPEIARDYAQENFGVCPLNFPLNFPVGKVTLVDVFPMTFLEFLDAVGESRLRAMLESLPSLDSIPELFHGKLTDLLKVYYVVGGMPEALDTYVREQSLERVRAVQRNILNTCALDFAKHAPREDVPRLGIVWDSVPTYLARENKKFIFSASKSKSLGVYRARFNPKLALRTTLLNLKQQDTLVNVPLYAVGVIPRLAEITGLLS